MRSKFADYLLYLLKKRFHMSYLLTYEKYRSHARHWGGHQGIDVCNKIKINYAFKKIHLAKDCCGWQYGSLKVQCSFYPHGIQSWIEWGKQCLRSQGLVVASSFSRRDHEHWHFCFAEISSGSRRTILRAEG